MKFNSQICTTKIQSERLLALGLKAETADMCINPSRELVYPFSYSEVLTLYDNYGLGKIMEVELLLPAWSLHRLIEMMPSFIEVDDNPFGLEFKIAQGKLVLYESIVEDSIGFVWGHGNLYDSIISCIGQLIKECHFNKEYLEEK